MSKFTREVVFELERRVSEQPHFIQIVVGPRQVGKTTAVLQLRDRIDLPCVYAVADSAVVPDRFWIQSKWRESRALLEEGRSGLLILDEAQMVPEWQSVVKQLWDEDRRNHTPLHVIVTGSSALLLKKGIESLAGRFEKHELLQWSFSEMQRGFGYTLEDYFIYGGYPGAASIKNQEIRWKEYVRSSIIEAVLTKDVIALSSITKPSLLRQLFQIACAYPAEIVSYTSFLGQLNDAGNVTTLSDYRLLLEDAYFVKTLEKWSGSTVRRRASKPKWIIRDNSLITALQPQPLSQIRTSPLYGRLVENAIINHLLKILPNGYYWREKSAEVDHVFQYSGTLYAIEIKSGRQVKSRNGLHTFSSRFPDSVQLIVGASGIPIEDVIASNEWRW